MMVMTTILTRLMAKSSGFRAKSGITGQSKPYSRNRWLRLSNNGSAGDSLEKRTVRASRLRYRPSYLTAGDTSGLCKWFLIYFDPI